MYETLFKTEYSPCQLVQDFSMNIPHPGTLSTIFHLWTIFMTGSSLQRATYQIILSIVGCWNQRCMDALQVDPWPPESLWAVGEIFHYRNLWLCVPYLPPTVTTNIIQVYPSTLFPNGNYSFRQQFFLLLWLLEYSMDWWRHHVVQLRFRTQLCRGISTHSLNQFIYWNYSVLKWHGRPHFK